MKRENPKILVGKSLTLISMIQEKAARAYPGFIVLPILILAGLVSLGGFGASSSADAPILSVISTLVLIPACIGLGGFFIVNPNQAVVGVLFGKYSGSVKTPGFWWMNPFTRKQTISLKINNFESGHLKVNDREGNPIEIAAIIVWKVVETAEALFNVGNYSNFIAVQSESAIRNMASIYPYDTHDKDEVSLRGSTAEIAEKLKGEIHDRLVQAGIEIVEARISHLAYAPEIAGTMLRRQQAKAIIAARQQIVEGAVGMVTMALDQIEASGKVRLDDSQKAAMVGNLLMVLTSDRDAQPVINAGSSQA